MMLIDIAKRAVQSAPSPPGAPEDSLISADFIPREVDAAAEKAEEIGRHEAPRRSDPLSARVRTEELADTAFLLTQNRLHRELALAIHHEEREQHRLDWLNLEIPELRKKVEKATAEVDARLGSADLWVGVLLLLAAAILMTSDVPLSLQLVARGLRIPSEALLVSAPDAQPAIYVRRAPVMSEEAQAEWDEAEQQGRTLSAADFFQKPLIAFSLFWDVYALGLGIAFLGLALKPILDILLGDEGQGRRAIGLSWVVLVLFVGSTWVLGQFRGDVIREELARPMNRELAQVEAKLAAENAKPPEERDAGETVRLNAEKANLEKRKLDAVGSRYSTPAFILLTVCLPLFGAVSFYYGVRKLDHRAIITRLHRQLSRLEKESDKHWRELAFWRSCRECREKYKKDVSEVDGKQAVRQRCAAMYESGLEKARQQRADALRSSDLFERLKENAYDAFVN